MQDHGDQLLSVLLQGEITMTKWFLYVSIGSPLWVYHSGTTVWNYDEEKKKKSFKFVLHDNGDPAWVNDTLQLKIKPFFSLYTE